jgi:hypothetical protein
VYNEKRIFYAVIWVYRQTKEKNMRFMGHRIGMRDLYPPPLSVNRQVTPMVDLIQQKECDIHYTVEQLKETKLFRGGGGGNLLARWAYQQN